MIQDICNKPIVFFNGFLKVAALMLSTITRAFVILGMLEGTATGILMTAALLLAITVRLLPPFSSIRDFGKQNTRGPSLRHAKGL